MRTKHQKNALWTGKRGSAYAGVQAYAYAPDMFHVLSRTLLILLLPFIAMTGWMLMFEDQYIYFPSQDVLLTPADVGLSFTEHQFRTQDDVGLHSWWVPGSGSRYTILHFHGNAGNISHRLHLHQRWHEMGLGVFAVDYRGYGKSGGDISEDGLYEDARASWRYLTSELGVPASQIIIAGRSMGCAVATELAGKVRPAGIVLETPFTNVPDLARAIYPWLPVSFLIRTKLETLARVGQLHLPMLLISAADDEIVPAGMAEKIFSEANEPKTRVALPGGHNGFDTVSEKAYVTAWKAWLATLPE